MTPDLPSVPDLLLAAEMLRRDASAAREIPALRTEAEALDRVVLWLHALGVATRAHQLDEAARG